jgi:glycosyltransferase involved in cell wall biosynthesis
MLDISIIIPTYNRLTSLLDTMDSLKMQSYPFKKFEVVIVDDGSTDKTKEVLQARQYPFPVQYIYEENEGSAVARNKGALAARGWLLVFLDDDMLVKKDFLLGLIEMHRLTPQLVGMGAVMPYIPTVATVFNQIMAKEMIWGKDTKIDVEVDFTHCETNNLSVLRDDFFRIGMMQDVAGDGPTWWGDVDFGYRAWQLGFQFFRSGQAQCFHRDHSLRDLETLSERYFRVAKMVHILFRKFPDIKMHIPMFIDKFPVDWKHDSFVLITKKIGRSLFSSWPIIMTMKIIVGTVERIYPSPNILRHLYRWILGGYLFQGLRTGLNNVYD